MPVCRQAGRDFILLCKKLDLFSGELVAIDGSKFKAVNSKKRNFNQQKLKKKIKEIEEKIEDYFKDLEENDVPVCRQAGRNLMFLPQQQRN